MNQKLIFDNSLIITSFLQRYLRNTPGIEQLSMANTVDISYIISGTDGDWVTLELNTISGIGLFR